MLKSKGLMSTVVAGATRSKRRDEGRTSREDARRQSSRVFRQGWIHNTAEITRHNDKVHELKAGKRVAKRKEGRCFNVFYAASGRAKYNHGQRKRGEMVV